MKKLIYLFAIIVATIALCSCEEKRWQESDLTLTEVLTLTISSTDTEAYYLYADHQFFIYEYNVNLNKYEMSDWSYVEEDGKTTISFKRLISESEYALYEAIYSTSTSSGRLTISYFDDDVELPDQESVQTISTLTSSNEYIDLN